MLDLNGVAEQCNKYSKMREKNGAFAKNDDLLKHCAGELLEACEKRVWVEMIADGRWPKSGMKTTLEEHEKFKREYADELMDVMFCVLVACNRANIDVDKALKKNIEKNRKRAEKIGDKL